MANEQETNPLSPIQPKDVKEQREWDNRHIRDLDMTELKGIARVMGADKLIVIGANEKHKEVMVSVLELPPHEYEELMEHLVVAAREGKVHQRVNGELWEREVPRKLVVKKIEDAGFIRRWLRRVW